MDDDNVLCLKDPALAGKMVKLMIMKDRINAFLPKFALTSSFHVSATLPVERCVPV